MAEGLTNPPATLQSTDDGAVGPGVASPPAARSRGRGRVAASSPHAGRFRTITAVLVGLAIAAVLVAVAIAANGRSTSAASARWSAWSPPDSGTQGAHEIADFVAPLYHASPADQLAVITVVDLESSTAAAAQQAADAAGTTTGASTGGLQVAVRPSSTSSQMSLLTGNTIAYNLCGIGGKNCTIGVGQASENRLLLLRREALELALYTFKYIHGTQNVVAILPPGHTVQTSTLTRKLPTTDATSQTVDMAVLFQRSELAPLLNVPVGETLPGELAPSVGEMASAPEAGLVQEATARGLFSERLEQAQDGSGLIVLDPLPPQ